MKNQALFSLKDKIKKLKCRLLQLLFGTLRVKGYVCNPQCGLALTKHFIFNFEGMNMVICCFCALRVDYLLLIFSIGSTEFINIINKHP